MRRNRSWPSSRRRAPSSSRRGYLRRTSRKFISSLPGEKRVAIESVGFIHPIYERLSSIKDCTVSVANPEQAPSHITVRDEERQERCKDLG